MSGDQKVDLYGRELGCPLCCKRVSIIEGPGGSEGSVGRHTMPAGRVRRSPTDLRLILDNEIEPSPDAFVRIEVVCPMSGAAVVIAKES